MWGPVDVLGKCLSFSRIKQGRPLSLHVGGDLILGGHVIVEPDEAKNDAHGFGDALVVGERHGLVQRDFDHLDKLPLPGLTSARAHAVVVGDLGIKHGLLGARHADA